MRAAKHKLWMVKMKKTNIKKIRFALFCLLIFLAIEMPTGFLKAKIFLAFAPDNSLAMHFYALPRPESTVCTDGVSPIFIDVALVDSNFEPVPFTLIKVYMNNFSGKIKPKYPMTDKYGRVTISILPDSLQTIGSYSNSMQAVGSYPNSIQTGSGYPDSDKLFDIDVSIELEAKKSKRIKCDLKLSPPPVLLIHGFQDTSESMVPLKLYLENKGLRVYAIDYTTNSDIEAMSEALSDYIDKIRSDLADINVFANKVDIVAHSLGGLVSRYYSTNNFYSEKLNIRKIIFINVPHHGTPWAEAGASLLDSPFLKQLYPTADLFTSTFPSSINKGLNHKIQVANIALENDEVVPLPSSMLDSWGINTKIFRIGSDPLSLESIISDQAGGSSKHRQILFFIPVFEDILQYLTYNQSYPQKRR